MTFNCINYILDLYNSFDLNYKEEGISTKEFFKIYDNQIMALVNILLLSKHEISRKKINGEYLKLITKWNRIIASGSNESSDSLKKNMDNIISIINPGSETNKAEEKFLDYNLYHLIFEYINYVLTKDIKLVDPEDIKFLIESNQPSHAEAIYRSLLRGEKEIAKKLAGVKVRDEDDLFYFFLNNIVSIDPRIVEPILDNCQNENTLTIDYSILGDLSEILVNYSESLKEIYNQCRDVSEILDSKHQILKLLCEITKFISLHEKEINTDDRRCYTIEIINNIFEVIKKHGNLFDYSDDKISTAVRILEGSLNKSNQILLDVIRNSDRLPGYGYLSIIAEALSAEKDFQIEEILNNAHCFMMEKERLNKYYEIIKKTRTEAQASCLSELLRSLYNFKPLKYADDVADSFINSVLRANDNYTRNEYKFILDELSVYKEALTDDLTEDEIKQRNQQFAELFDMCCCIEVQENRLNKLVVIMDIIESELLLSIKKQIVTKIISATKIEEIDRINAIFFNREGIEQYNVEGNNNGMIQCMDLVLNGDNGLAPINKIVDLFSKEGILQVKPVPKKANLENEVIEIASGKITLSSFLDKFYSKETQPALQKVPTTIRNIELAEDPEFLDLSELGYSYCLKRKK